MTQVLHSSSPLVPPTSANFVPTLSSSITFASQYKQSLCPKKEVFIQDFTGYPVQQKQVNPRTPGCRHCRLEDEACGEISNGRGSRDSARATASFLSFARSFSDCTKLAAGFSAKLWIVTCAPKKWGGEGGEEKKGKGQKGSGLISTHGYEQHPHQQRKPPLAPPQI